MKIKSKTIPHFPKRGGASLIESNGKLIVFGGANREGTHFADMAVCTSISTNCTQDVKSSSWKVVEARGDVPNARSGHAVCSIGKYMLLHGGINYIEEIAYNDFYILDTETMTWKYVGETGEEISARNSHSLHVLPVKGCERLLCLTLYGGASPVTGPLGDTYFAIIDPSSDAFGGSEFFVHWQKLGSEMQQDPIGREMYSSCVTNGTLLIVGGRKLNGTLLSDAWVLEAVSKCHGVKSIRSTQSIDTTRTDTETEICAGREEMTFVHLSSSGMLHHSLSNVTDASGETSALHSPTVNVSWRRAPEFDLLEGRCAHGMAITPVAQSAIMGEVHRTAIIKTSSTTDAAKESESIFHGKSDTYDISYDVSVCIFGGLTLNGISNELLVNSATIVISSYCSGSIAGSSTPLHFESTQSIRGWKQLSLGESNSELHGRIGACMCTCPRWYQDNGESTGAIEQARVDDSVTGADAQAVLVFGGVSARTDFNDVVRIQL